MRIISIIVLLACLSSCEKDTFNSGADARLYISADTLGFDTVFTSTGSVSLTFKIRNENEEKIRISSIRLMGGNASPFSININGTATSEATDLELEGNDSLYVFVAVTINPNAANLPFVVRDSIRISWNGNTRFVQLEAYGQNARFLQNVRIHSDTLFTPSLPYVILGPLIIDSGATLQIEAGSRLYFHANASLQVRGSLRVSGNESNRVTFTGDRLDLYYKDLPGSWGGIAFSASSQNNLLEYCSIKNAVNGISSLGPGGGSEKILMRQCIIDNCLATGLLSDNSSLRAENCLISNCGGNLRVKGGGACHLIHCTLVSYSNLFISHNEPVAFLTDAAEPGNSTSPTAPLNASFTNCIFWGSGGIVSNEVITDKAGNQFAVTFDHCLYKADTDPADATLTSVLKNPDPSFDSVDTEENYFDFRITKNPNAPGINYGTPTPLTVDLDGKNRNIGLPDLGCYEKQ